MITVEAAKAEIATGLSAVCSWCEHWHTAKDNGSPLGCERMKCGGPSVGRGFPAYKGPMEGTVHLFCFICGKDPHAIVEIGGRKLGVCGNIGPGGKACVDKFRDIMAKQKVIVRERVVPVIGGEQ
jgi:hypothetical protein